MVGASLYYFAAAALFLTVQAQCPQNVAQFPSEAQGSGLLPPDTFLPIILPLLSTNQGPARLTVRNASVVLSMGPYGFAIEMCATVLGVTPNSARAVFALSNRPLALAGIPSIAFSPILAPNNRPDWIACVYLEWTSQEPRVMTYTQAAASMNPDWTRQLFPTDGAISPLSRCSATPGMQPPPTTTVHVSNATMASWVPWDRVDPTGGEPNRPGPENPPMALPLGSGTACPRRRDSSGLFDSPIAEFPPLLRGSTLIPAATGGTCRPRPPQIVTIGDSGVSVTTLPTDVSSGYVLHACLSSITPVAQLVDTSPGADLAWAAQGYEVELSIWVSFDTALCMWIVPSRPLWQQSDLQPVAPARRLLRLSGGGLRSTEGDSAQRRLQDPADDDPNPNDDFVPSDDEPAPPPDNSTTAPISDDDAATDDDPYSATEDLYDGELVFVAITGVITNCPSVSLTSMTISGSTCRVAADPLWCSRIINNPSASCTIARGTRFWYDGRGLPPTDPILAEAVAAQSVLWEQGVLTSPLPTPSAFSSPSASLTPSGSSSPSVSPSPASLSPSGSVTPSGTTSASVDASTSATRSHTGSGTSAPSGTGSPSTSSSSSGAATGGAGGVGGESIGGAAPGPGPASQTAIIGLSLGGVCALVVIAVALLVIRRSGNRQPLMRRSWEVAAASEQQSDGGDEDGDDEDGGEGGNGARSPAAPWEVAATAAAAGGSSSHDRARSVRRAPPPGSSPHDAAGTEHVSPIGARSSGLAPLRQPAAEAPVPRGESKRARYQRPPQQQATALPRGGEEASVGVQSVVSPLLLAAASSRRAAAAAGVEAGYPSTIASSTTAGSTTASLFGSGGSSTGGASTPSGSSMTGFSNPVSRRDTRAWAGEHGHNLPVAPHASAVSSGAPTARGLPIAAAAAAVGGPAADVNAAPAAEEEAAAVPPKAAAYDVIGIPGRAFSAAPSHTPAPQPPAPRSARRALPAAESAAACEDHEKSITISLAAVPATAAQQARGRGAAAAARLASQSLPLLQQQGVHHEETRQPGGVGAPAADDNDVGEKMVVIGLSQC